jgi:hypothetical protein
MGYNTYQNPLTQQFIDACIRPDGFSTFRRGAAPVQPLSKADQYALATIQTGQRLNITPKGICIALSVELVETNLTMYANSNVPASLNLPHDAVGSDHDSTGLFQQRQAWGPLSSTMDPALSAQLFFLGGQGGQRGLTDFDYNSDSRTPGGWAQAVQVSAFPDRYDARYDDAVAIYNRLSTSAPPDLGDDMAAVPQDQWDRVYRELTQKLPSRSPLRHLDQTQFYPDGLVDTMAGMLLNTDGSEHVQYVSLLAGYGHPPTLALLREVAGADPNQYPDRQDDAKLAQAILAGVTSAPAPVGVNNGAPAPNPAPQIVYLPAPQPAAVATVAATPSNGDSTGAVIGRAYDALEALRLADALPIEGRAPLAALISVLSTKNGASLT